MQVFLLKHAEEDYMSLSSFHRPGTWQEVLSTEDESQRLARVEGYNNYVDIVESQLGREIAALQEHSTEFFQASSFLEASLCSTKSYFAGQDLPNQIGSTMRFE